LMERMIAELFPCGDDEEASFGNGNNNSSGNNNSNGETSTGTPLPSFEEFLKHICRRTRTPLTCMCLALLYLTRLRANHPRSRGSPGSSYRLALSSLCVATKYLYDDAYHTCSWVQVSLGLFNQREVNQMEMEFMYFLNYQLGVTPTEWNQWIATLEAKLVARWQDKGRADVIYGFGLFLSYECCEPNAQEAVRDIAWGEGGKSLLSLLNNAIHSSDSRADGKSSPSADSAVSDATCLPTPDPNSWFRIKSPVLLGAEENPGLGVAAPTSALAGSNSITPVSAQGSEMSVPTDDRQVTSGLQKHTLRNNHSRHSYIELNDVSPSTHKYANNAGRSNSATRQHLQATIAASSHTIDMRPSSACSVQAVSLSDGYHDHGSKHASGVGSAHATYRHTSEFKSQDWMIHQTTPMYSHEPSSSQVQQQHQLHKYNVRGSNVSQRLSHLGSESTMVAHVHNARNAVDNISPLNSYSGHTTRMSISYSAESRNDGGVDLSDHIVVSAQRSAASTLGGSSGLHFSASAVSSTANAIPCGASATFVCRDQRMNTLSGASSAMQTKYTPNLTVHHVPGTAPFLPSSSCAPSPDAEQRNGGTRHLGSSAIANASCAPSAKSSTSSLKAVGRRHSWRHSAKNPATTSFAQKLRSFAAFTWASGGGQTGNVIAETANLNALPRICRGTDGSSMEDVTMESSIPLQIMSSTAFASENPHEYQRNIAMFDGAATVTGTGQSGFSRRLADAQGQRASLAN
ncbi:hypothetical protein GGF37_005251, partial [Kickxella alabastrina]